MIAYLILGIALLSGLLLAGQWYVHASPKSVLRVLKWVLIGLIVAIALFFIWSGRLVWAMAAVPALLPWFFRALQAARMAKSFHRMAGGGGFGGGSDPRTNVTSRYLDMSLDHATGGIDGAVREGPFAGRRLNSLDRDELTALHALCQADADSLKLLEAYLDRNHPDWRSSDGNNAHAKDGGARTGVMDRSEALAILGLEEGASEDEIRKAHHRLIANLHPDKGGSSYLAAQINRAKDVLLG